MDLSNRITHVKIDENEVGNPYIDFNIDGKKWMEWINNGKVERVDSNIEGHYEGDICIQEILDYLDECMSSMVEIVDEHSGTWIIKK